MYQDKLVTPFQAFQPPDIRDEMFEDDPENIQRTITNDRVEETQENIQRTITNDRVVSDDNNQETLQTGTSCKDLADYAVEDTLDFEAEDRGDDVTNNHRVYHDNDNLIFLFRAADRKTRDEEETRCLEIVSSEAWSTEERISASALSTTMPLLLLFSHFYCVYCIFYYYYLSSYGLSHRERNVGVSQRPHGCVGGR